MVNFCNTNSGPRSVPCVCRVPDQDPTRWSSSYMRRLFGENVIGPRRYHLRLPEFRSKKIKHEGQKSSKYCKTLNIFVSFSNLFVQRLFSRPRKNRCFCRPRRRDLFRWKAEEQGTDVWMQRQILRTNCHCRPTTFTPFQTSKTVKIKFGSYSTRLERKTTSMFFSLMGCLLRMGSVTDKYA